MVKNIQIVLSGDTAVTYETEKGLGSLHFSTIQPYWDYADEETIEGTRVYTLDDDRTLMVLFTVASGQGGIVVCWDTVTREITHLSGAEYSVAAAYHNDTIYTLDMVSNFTTAGGFGLSKIAYGVKDAWKEVDIVDGFNLELTDDFNGSYDDIDLFVDDHGVSVRIKDEIYENLKA